MEPFYFGLPTQPLFGCYHVPQSGRVRQCGIVLCYPMGHEYLAAHRAYWQLALHLSQAGFPLLRFDFYGCGDSAGDDSEGGLRQWLSDIARAIDELRRRCRAQQLCLVGLRLGGALAVLAGAERGDLAGLVLWDPVVNGRAYVEELTRLQQETLRHSPVQLQGPRGGARPTEILGFPLTPSLLTDLENLDLMTIQERAASRILLIDTGIQRTTEHFRAHLCSRAQVECQHMPTPPMWVESLEKILVPGQVLQAVVTWLSEVFP